MRGTSWIAVVLVILAGSVVGIAGGTFFATYLPTISNNGGLGQVFEKPFQGKRFARVLMIGEDDTAKNSKNGNGLSDTLVVMSIDTEAKEIRALSIPRDTMVEIPGHGTCKINSAHVYGGPEMSRQVVQNLLNVPIDYYIKTSTSGLRGLVDMVGGVYIVVEKNMRYTDRRGGLYINLKASPEKQLLNGREAEGYVRFRHDAFGDSGYEIKDGKRVPTGRVVRQQYFLRALANRVLSLPTKRERLQMLDTSFERGYLVSDLNLKDWQGLMDLFKDFDPTKVKMAVLPGKPENIRGGSYWVCDPMETVRVVNENLLFQEPPAKVEVLNGSGVSGAAGRVAERLAKEGFEVTRTDNAPKSDYSESCVIRHKGKTDTAQRIASILNCNQVCEEDATSDADITVIVGRNNSD